MNIGTVAERSGVAPKTIRYYETIGLIDAAGRKPNGYRVYSEADMRTLNFIKRARGLGFSVDEVRGLLDMWRDKSRSNAKVKAMATRHLEELNRKIEELQSVRAALSHLVKRCRGDTRPDCPILDNLGTGASQ